MLPVMGSICTFELLEMVDKKLTSSLKSKEIHIVFRYFFGI